MKKKFDKIYRRFVFIEENKTFVSVNFVQFQRESNLSHTKVEQKYLMQIFNITNFEHLQ